MGKVGSKTIALSLRKSHLPNPVFDTHFMAQDHIDKADEFQRSLGLTKTPWGHIRGKHLRQLGKLTWGRSRWKIITLVRDPVARDISDLFQNPFHFLGLSGLKGDLFIAGAISELQTSLASFNEDTDYTVCWFDWELKEMFGVDVYNLPFDPAQGYAIYPTEHADILLLRLEDLSRCASRAFREFLGIKDIKLLIVNEGLSRQLKNEYQQLLGVIVFPQEVLDRVYDSRYSRHFYTETEITGFKKRWMKLI